MKKIIALVCLLLLIAVPSYAAYASKGQIPQGEPVEYRGLKVLKDGVDIIIINRGEKTVTFSAACSFVNERGNQEYGNFYVAEMKLGPLEQIPLKNLYLKGDYKSCRKADRLSWTIYVLEEK